MFCKAIKTTLSKVNLYWLLKVAIVGFCCYFLYERLIKIDFVGFYALFQHSFQSRGLILFITLFLVFFNWGIETKKWQFLIQSIENLTFLSAFKAIMGGVAFSSFTPNRVGEFAGRMLFLKNKLDTRIVALTIVGSMSQLMVTLVFGLPGFLVFLFNHEVSALLNKQWIQWLLISLPFIYAIVFWNLPKLFRLFKQKFKTNKTLNYLSESIVVLGLKGLRYVSILSFLRYMVFTFQYMFILLFFNIEMIWWQYFIYIPAIFFIQSVVPSFIITELGVRVTVAIAVIGLLAFSDSQIMAASTLLWVINLMVPALIGAITILLSKPTFKS